MKIGKRLTSMLVVFLMILSLVACAGGGGASDVGGSSVGGSESGSESGSGSGGSDQFVMPERPVDETAGKTYIIIQHSDVGDPFGYAQNSKIGQQIAGRIEEIEEIYGCTVDFSRIPYGNDYVTQVQALQYGEGGGDLAFADENAKLRLTLGTGGQDSLMVDLLTVDHIINFWNAGKWGDITAREAMMAGGTFYGVSPALWAHCTPLPHYQVVYNKAIVEAAGVTDPQESWEREAWDRDAMIDVIQGTTAPADGIWGMTATDYHMTRATFLSTGKVIVNVDKINADGTVEWTHGLKSPEAQEALTWLRNTLLSKGNCFNNGKKTWETWESHVPFNQQLCAMAVTRPHAVFDSVAVDCPDPFGIITWAGAEANILTGYHEQLHSVAIPTFAQNVEHSAFLMADLFEGLDGVEDYEDVLDYYREKYFTSDIDMECLVRQGAILQYSYHPNDSIDTIWNAMASELLRTSSVSALINKHVDTKNIAIEKHILPNTLALAQWEGQVDFD